MKRFLTQFIFSIYLLGASFTMEETFVVTGALVLIIGTVLGFLIEWVFRKENEKNKTPKDDDEEY